MSIPQEAPPPREFDPEHDQFAAVATQLLSVMQRHPEYYKEQATEILDKLNKAKGDFERGEVPIPQGVRVKLFGGLQTRDESKSREREANRIVEDLYISLNKLAGYQPANYDDIEKDALDLAAKHLKINESLGVNHLSAVHWVKGDRLALAESGKLTGIKIKISENILASFRLGNFGAPEDTGNMTFVDLFVVSAE